MQHPEAAGGQVLAGVVDHVQLPVEGAGDGVDGEVAPAEVLGQRGGTHVGQRPGRGVRLGPRPRDPDGEVPGPRLGGAEALVHVDDLAELGGQRRGVALDDEVEVADRPPEQGVAHRAADHPDAGTPAEGVEHAGHARLRAQVREDVHPAQPRRRPRPSRVFRMAPRRPGRQWATWAALAGSFLVLAAAVVVVLATGREGDVSHPDVEFDRARTQPAATQPEQTAPRGHPADDRFEWPVFGLTKERTHVLPLRRSLRPPFRTAWAERGSVLIEFTPVLCGRSVYLLKNNGALYKVSRWTGHVEWKRKLGTLAASSPACSHGRVHVVLLRGKTGSGGRVVSLSQRTGKIRWARTLPSRAESSPLLDHGRLYFGTENGTVYALRVSDGAVRWTYRAGGAVKGAIALDRGRLFFGDYAGAVTALRRRDGSRLWRVSAAGGGAFGGGGNFYSSAAVAYGRVYIGSTNGAVYSLATRDGKLAWRKQTGAYVYASPAVGAVDGGPPTVWIGSYNGTFYALDARSGGVRWSRSLGGKISGSASVIGDAVFVSSIGLKSTWALGANTGKTLWKTRRGAFHPAISDGRRLYFNGYASLFGLDPKGVHFAARAARSARRPTAAQRRAARAAARRARHRRYVDRRVARHRRYLERVCARIQRNPKRRRARLKAHHCWDYYADVRRARARARAHRRR